MMGFGYRGINGYDMGFVGTIGLILWLVAFVDLILLGVWLWKQIQKKGK